MTLLCTLTVVVGPSMASTERATACGVGAASWLLAAENASAWLVVTDRVDWYAWLPELVLFALFGEKNEPPGEDAPARPRAGRRGPADGSRWVAVFVWLFQSHAWRPS